MKYSQLQKKYSLPDFDILDYEFEIEKDKPFILREIRRKIQNKFEVYCDLLHGLLQPDTSSIEQMYEVTHFDENKKTEVFKLYKKLMKLSRYAVESALDGEELEAEFINDAFKEWKTMKEQLRVIVSKMKSSWDENDSEEKDLRYLG